MASALDKVRDELDQIDPDDVARSSIPIGVLDREARAILKLCRHDAARFTMIGFDDGFFEAFETHIEALREAEDAWQEVHDHNAMGAALKEALEQAYEKRSLALDLGEYYFRRVPDAMALLDRIRHGEGHEDLIADLRALARAMREHAEAFRPHSDLDVDAFSRDLEERARDLSERFARYDSDTSRDEALDTRDRAYTLLDEDLDDVRAAARLIYRDQPEMRARFVSPYRRRVKQKSRARRAQSPPTHGDQDVPRH